MEVEMHLALLLMLLCSSQAHPDTDRAGEDVDTVGEPGESLTSTILRMNNGSKDFLLEGDIMLPVSRNAMKCLNPRYSCLWEKSANGKVEVPFQISDDYTPDQKSTIQKAMDDFHSKTCIRFIPRQGQNVYITVESKYGCFSAMGRMGDKQVVSLSKYGCVTFGIAQHELLHALGFYHEHTRSDRDDHVQIKWDNINKDNFDNFVKQDTINLDTPYDYTSVMHYDTKAFAINYQVPTIVPIPDASVPIGQRKGMSASDISRINMLYTC
ncbi:low choriolytic enzyme-like [Aplochiton taeniatus]